MDLSAAWDDPPRWPGPSSGRIDTAEDAHGTGVRGAINVAADPLTGGRQLADWIVGRLPHDQGLVVGVAALGPDPDPVATWVEVLAESLAAGRGPTLLVDLHTDQDSQVGLTDVVHNGLPIQRAANPDPHRRLVRVGPGTDRDRIPAALAEMQTTYRSGEGTAVVGLPLAGPLLDAAVDALDRVMLIVRGGVLHRDDLRRAIRMLGYHLRIDVAVLDRGVVASTPQTRSLAEALDGLAPARSEAPPLDTPLFDQHEDDQPRTDTTVQSPVTPASRSTAPEPDSDAQLEVPSDLFDDGQTRDAAEVDLHVPADLWAETTTHNHRPADGNRRGLDDDVGDLADIWTRPEETSPD